MLSFPKTALLLLGLACAGILLLPAGGQAQGRIDTSIAPPPRSKPPVPPRRPAVEAPVEEGADPVPAVPAAADNEDDTSLEDQQDGGRLAPSGADWETSLQREPDAPLDGIVEVDEPLPVPDGIADLRRDPRMPEDIAAFEKPPAGFDPYLYQIEPEPLRDRRPGELFRMEPYVALGVRIGSFVVFPEAEVGAISTNNIFRSPSRQGDTATEVRSNVRVVSDWRAHAVEFRAAGLASFYGDFASENDRAYSLESRGRLDITRRTNIEALVSHQFDKDSRSARDSPAAAAERGDIETSRAAVTLNHRFNRLGLQIRGSVSDIDYASVPSIAGGLIGNDERDFTQREVAVRAGWQLSRKAEVFAETAVNDRDFHAAPADGILRSSKGERYRVGLAFGPWDATIRGEVSAGWGRQGPNDARLDDLEGFIVDANLAWRASPLTTFLLTARSEFVDTNAADSAGALSRQVGLEARHAIRRHLIGIAGVRYAVAPYDGISLTERETAAELGLEYYLGPDAIVFGRYEHVAYDTTTPGGDYKADTVRVGLRVRR